MELELESILLPGIEDKRPMVIAGPCSAETEEQVMCTAKQLAEKGMKIFRAGIWKPRTKPGGFEGVGVDGLAWLKEVKKETGMYVSTEVATSKHVYECLKAGIDILWIGARTTANPFAMQEIAAASSPITAAIAPPAGTASCIKMPLFRTSSNASSAVMTPDAINAPYSPRLNPAVTSG